MPHEALTATRRRELAALQRMMERPEAGAARFARVTGEPWTGKTRLLGHLAGLAAQDGWQVAWGRAPRTGRSSPFDVLVDALDEHLVRADGSLYEQLGAARTAALAPYFPSLATGRDPAPRVEAYDTVCALRALLHLLAQGPGLLLILDDVHRASPEVLDVLEHLVRHPPDKVFTVFAHRAPAVQRHLSAIGYHAEEVPHLPLARLDDAEAARFLPPQLTPLQRELALRDGAGVPGLLRTLAAGPPPWEGRDYELYGARELSVGVPPAFPAHAVGLHTLSSLGWRTACAAAVVGDPFTADVVAATAALPLDDVLHGIDELHGEGLIEPRDGARRFAFARPLVRALVHHASGAGWRAAARPRAVAALRHETAGGGPPAGGAPAALAALLEDAPELTDDDVRTLALTARDVLFTRPWSAVRALRRVTADVNGPVEADLLLHRALVVAGRVGEAAAQYKELLPHLHEAATGLARAQAVVWHARTLRLTGRSPEARAMLDTLADSPHGAAEAAVERATLALESGDVHSGTAAARRAAAATDAAAEPELRGHALALLAAGCAAAGNVPEARQTAQAAARLLDPLDDDRLARCLAALCRLGEAEHALGDDASAQRHLARGLRVALTCAQGHLIGEHALGLARIHLAAGDLARAEARARLAADAARWLGGGPLAAAAREVCGRVEALASGEAPDHQIAQLSARELEIAKLVGSGYTNRSIAARLDISAKTVETYMSRIFKKLGANSRAQVAHAMGRNYPR
ncbi:helix-turn-helix transcriptional regulator [Streptomyces sp. O3]